MFWTVENSYFHTKRSLKCFLVHINFKVETSCSILFIDLTDSKPNAYFEDVTLNL